MKKLTRIIKNSKKVLIATHIDPDADGIAAALCCGYLVQHYKKRKPTIYCCSSIPSKYKFLMGKWKFVNRLPVFDLLIAVDSASISRVFPDEKHVRAAKLGSKTIVNIDHHKSNDSFGSLKIVEKDVSSSCEIIFKIFEKLRVRISKTLADILYCGIYSETGGFSYPNTTGDCLKIAGQLIGLGVKPSVLVKRLNAKTLSGTLLLSEVLNTIEIKNGVAVMCLTQDMLKISGARMTDSENFVSFLNALNNVNVALFLREEVDGVRVSLRSDGIIDVDKLASRYGGGGHRLAAGLRLKKDLRTVKREMLRAIQGELERRT